MQHLFWLLPDKLAGRTGPDRDPWDLASLKAAGIGAVLSVNDGRLCHPGDFRAHGIEYACIPFSPNAPPEPGDDEVCLRALPLAGDFLRQNLSKGLVTVVHCTSGKDRTGLLLAYHLVRDHGLSIPAAVEEVRRVRPIALSAPGWYEFAFDLLGRVS